MATHTVSVVIPVYQGEKTLEVLVQELLALGHDARTPGGHRFEVSEVLLVFDHGPDGSAEVIRRLAEEQSVVRPIWLSRNFGQHAATLAGMASSGGDWIVTMDEDGQHDPADLPRMLDVAMAEHAPLVYAEPTNPPPHGPVRNAASKAAKWLFVRVLSSGQVPSFESYRLVLGELGRSVAAYAGSGVYLDVAIGWVADRSARCPVRLRQEGRASGYSFRRLLSHFWRLVLSSGTRTLRLVSVTGVVFAVLGFVLAAYYTLTRLTTDQVVQGWTSTMVAVLVGTGMVLFALGVIAEYVGVAVSMAMGKPPYLIATDPERGPLGRRLNDAPLRDSRR
ncbi:glycosyltransferase [Nocardioides islandensis]|uniref:Glycosyltransferase n=1 Tax=Nocardioides islandensis TaxID=433663 RepID=A0A930VCF7_9ACTN|nr:glycosyltransferase [Nocardioides islandensis]